MLNKEAQTEQHSIFQLAILDEELTASAQGIGQDWQTAWPILQLAYPSQVSYAITEYDVESYDWGKQVITLNIAVSEAILKQFNLTFDDCGTYREKECLSHRAFVVAYDSMPLYGGITFWPQPILPPRFQYPVIYPALSDEGHITFTIRPYKALNKDFSEEDWSLIKDKKIEGLFDGLGKLIK